MKSKPLPPPPPAISTVTLAPQAPQLGQQYDTPPTSVRPWTRDGAGDADGDVATAVRLAVEAALPETVGAGEDEVDTGLHALAPEPLLKVPAAHAVQAVEEDAAANEEYTPAAQAVQAVDEEAADKDENAPARHDVHTAGDAAAGCDENKPATQAVQAAEDVAAVKVEYAPAAHPIHAVLPGSEAYVPGRHAPAVGAGSAETAAVGDVDAPSKLADGTMLAAMGDDVELNEVVGDKVGVELRGEALGEAVSEGEHENTPMLNTTSLPLAPAVVGPHVPASVTLAGFIYEDPPPPPPP